MSILLKNILLIFLAFFVCTLALLVVHEQSSIPSQYVQVHQQWPKKEDFSPGKWQWWQLSSIGERTCYLEQDKLG